jgi:uncharacterized membrane protein YgdD (TMEM256/DUF423 family)
MFCATAVILGAFGAHALQSVLSPKAMGWIDTGTSYQTTHALALIACGVLPYKGAARTAWLFSLGIIVFSGSLYLMAITGITMLGAITPLGGLSLIAGWISFCWMVWSAKS